MGAIFDIKGKRFETYKNFSEYAAEQSSTWRELKAIQFSLNAMPNVINGKAMLWHTDNIATARIVKRGSTKIHFQTIALDIFSMRKAKNIKLSVTWISRKFNNDADLLSKTIDYDDWHIKSHCFETHTTLTIQKYIYF